MGTASGPNNHLLLNALRHPLRRQILRAMADGEPTSPRDLADQLDQPLSSVSYHVKILEGCEALQPVSSRQVRGATQHFYRSVVEAEWAQTALEGKDELSPKKSRGEETS